MRQSAVTMASLNHNTPSNDLTFLTTLKLYEPIRRSAFYSAAQAIDGHGGSSCGRVPDPLLDTTLGSAGKQSEGAVVLRIANDR